MRSALALKDDPKKLIGYFSPVVAIPVVTYFCKKAKTTEIGKSVRTVIARIRCH